MPAAICRSLRRPADPSGRSAPAGFAVSSADDLLRLLPAGPPRFRPGDRPVAGWELEELLGVGGFGEVWKARHPRLRNLPPVALKFCLGEDSARYLRHEAALIDRLMGYSRALPGLVELRNAHLDADPPCLEFEYIAGGDLCGLMHQWGSLGAPQRVEQAGRLVRRLATTLTPLHRLDPPVVHRDLKPSNILLAVGDDRRLAVKIGDFGLGGLSAGRSLARPGRGAAGATC